MTNRWKKILLACTGAFLAAGSISLTLFPAPRFAEVENRYLAQFPALTATGLLDGSVMTALDSYATERAPFRAPCRALWSITQLGLGEREVHDVILCRDGSLARRLAADEDVLTRNLAALPRIREALGDVPLTVAVAPRRIDARCEVLPVLYNSERDLALYEALPEDTVTFPECCLDAEWFRTDHHWTAAGAYRAYVRLGKELGFTPYPREAFTHEMVSDHFLGTSYAAAGIPFVAPDEITLWRYENDHAFRVTRDGAVAAFSGLYDREKLSTHDGYAVFLGGNCGVLEISLGDGDDRPVLLVIRDSFAGALLPFLARHYRIVAVDSRYRACSLSSLAQSADAALVLCGMQTISAEPFLTPLLRK